MTPAGIASPRHIDKQMDGPTCGASKQDPGALAAPLWTAAAIVKLLAGVFKVPPGRGGGFGASTQLCARASFRDH